MYEIIIIPSRFSYNFLIKFFYNFELCDHWIRLSFIFGENGLVSRSNSGDLAGKL